MIKRRFLLSLLVLLTMLLVACAEPPYTNIDATQMLELQKQGVAVYDIRREEEWRQTGVVEGSKQLTAFDRSGRFTPQFLPEFMSETDRQKPVVLICRTGNRTSALAKFLAEEKGYSSVYSVSNGITGWKREGKPVVKCDKC